MSVPRAAVVGLTIPPHAQVVFSDISSREMRVFATDLIESSEVIERSLVHRPLLRFARR